MTTEQRCTAPSTGAKKMREGLGDCGGSSDGLEWSAVGRLA